MPAIIDRDTLEEEVAAWLEREGDSVLMDRMPAILQGAESWFNRKLLGYQREVETTLTTDTDGKVALPAGFIAIKSVELNGRPYQWSISGSSLRIRGAGASTFDVVFKSRLPALSDSQPTNWLLDLAPDAYLYACMAQASVMLEAFQQAAVYTSQASDILAALNLQSLAAQYGMASLTPAVQVP